MNDTVKEEIMPEIKVAIEPISLPTPWQSFLKEEPIEDFPVPSLDKSEKRKLKKSSEDSENGEKITLR